MSVFELRQLGASDVMVTPVIFGAWAVGGWMWGGNDEADSIAAIRASIDHGVTTIDTAAVYGQGYGEEVVGKAIQGLHDQVQIATKGGMTWDLEGGSDPWATQDPPGPRHPDPPQLEPQDNPHRMRAEPETARRGRHRPLPDPLARHHDARRGHDGRAGEAQGSRQDPGHRREQLRRGVDQEAAAAGPLASLQPPYSLIQRKIEKEILPTCRELNVGVIAYSPMERGLLAGTVPADRIFPPGDHRATHKFFKPENRALVLESLEKVRPIAEKHGVSLAQMVINWTIQVPGITAAIVGARNAEQAEHNAKALSFRLSPEECAEIRQAFDATSATMMAS